MRRLRVTRATCQFCIRPWRISSLHGLDPLNANILDKTEKLSFHCSELLMKIIWPIKKDISMS